MALNIPKVGFSRMLKEGARHFSGVEESVIRNIEACTELAATLRSAYGPNGMNKMVINHLEKLFVTNDAATILNELQIQHPAARMLVIASHMQEQEVGDGTNLVIILAGAFLEHAEELLRMGLTPTEVAEGYERASKKAYEILPTLSCGKIENVHDKEAVTKAIRSAIMSKQYGCEDFLAKLVTEACMIVLPKQSDGFNVDNIRVVKILGSGMQNSQVVRGMLFKRGVEGDVKKVDKAKVAVFTCPFDITQTETKGTILIKNADELLNYSKGEEDVVEKQIKALAESNVNVVVSAGKFGDLYIHFLNKYGIMGVRLNSKFDVRRLCKATGATALPRISPPAIQEIGFCDHIFVDEIGETEVVIFKQDEEKGQIATVVLRGSTENIMDDIERAIDDGVNNFKALTKDGRLLPGAGATEIELARQIEAFGGSCPGLEQYAITKYAQSLENVPKILAENSGARATEVLSKLYAAHQEGKVNAGFDNEANGGGVTDAVAAGIFDLYYTKVNAIRLATNAASTVLRVDQIIMAKQVSGPKPQSKGQDEDD